MGTGANWSVGEVPDVVVPVPESRRLLKPRRKDTTWLLASAAASELGAPMVGDALVRKGRRRQVGLTSSQREDNARISFFAGAAVKNMKGSKVLLVDDVYTTGATVRACSRILKKHCSQVSVLTFSRRSADKLQHLLVDRAVGGYNP
jgi:predicted amidophosphoribosyltransferase